MKRIVVAGCIIALTALPVLAGPIMRADFRNKSKETVVELYLIQPNAERWGRNELSAPVPPGGRAWMILEDGADKCIGQLRLVTDSGTEFETGLVFCGAPRFTYHGRP
jgi:hypothetical protein